MFEKYETINFDHLIGLEGFSGKLLENHFKLYQGYVQNTNDLAEYFSEYDQKDFGKDPGFAERKRRFGWEFNGMRLHEQYFGNLSKSPSDLEGSSGLAVKIREDFHSLENWVAHFKGMGAMRGIGWVLLVHDPETERLHNIWINEHDLGHLAGAHALLVLDVFEHAFMLDYGMEKDKYIAAFWKAIHWAEVERRFEAARKVASHAERG